MEIEDEHGRLQPWGVIKHPGGGYFSLIEVMELDGDPETEEGQAQHQMFNDILVSVMNRIYLSANLITLLNSVRSATL